MMQTPDLQKGPKLGARSGQTLQHFREAIPGNHNSKFLIHDRDSIFSPNLDRELESFGLRVS